VLGSGPALMQLDQFPAVDRPQEASAAFCGCAVSIYCLVPCKSPPSPGKSGRWAETPCTQPQPLIRHLEKLVVLCSIKTTARWPGLLDIVDCVRPQADAAAELLIEAHRYKFGLLREPRPNPGLLARTNITPSQPRCLYYASPYADSAQSCNGLMVY
jgi:hypothetical protein